MKKILIADDSLYQRKVLGGIVQELGHEFEAVSSGEELLEKVDNTFDCIFLDLLMTGMSGIEVLSQLKERGHETPVVVISADIQQARQEECMSLGATAFVEKVVNKEELEAALNQVFTN